VISRAALARNGGVARRLQLTWKKGSFMRTLRNLLIGLSCVGLLALVFPAPAQADAFNKKTFFTFSAPVELPGLVLPAGTYMFRLADPDADSSVVRVFNHDGSVCYGTFFTLPDARVGVLDRPSVAFEERAAGSPEAIRTWSYPGDDTAREFMYQERHSSN
jgi:hypothetical protein